MLNWIGWVATATFATSYFFKQPGSLRRVQALAALLWIGYGILIHAPPVIAANLVVAAVALYSSWRPNAKMWTWHSNSPPPTWKTRGRSSATTRN